MGKVAEDYTYIVCPKTGKIVSSQAKASNADPGQRADTGGRSAPLAPCHRVGASRRGFGLWTCLLPIAGLFSLAWFLIRVVPKPSRAAYPCQRAAAPLAGGFLLWLGGMCGSWLVFRQARTFFCQARRPLAFICIGLAAALAVIGLVHAPQMAATAALAPTPLSPVGTAKGIHPGRVVWSFDPAATNWAGPNNGHWWEPSHTDQAEVDAMMSSVIRALTGQGTDADAWSALFGHFNQTHGRGSVGYQAGEKIAIKVNFVGFIQLYPTWGGCNPANHDLVSMPDYMNTSPQAILALLRQLVHQAGVPQANIYIGDPTCYWADPWFNYCHAEFPDVHYMEFTNGSIGGTEGREGVQRSSVPIYWSSHPAGVTQDYLPQHYAQASYFISLANLKSHTAAGVTLCGKNHYGSLIRTPNQAGYYDLHASLPSSMSAMGLYRVLVDLMGHAHTGGKGLLFLIDGLYAGRHPIDFAPTRWTKPPFNGDWSSSLFASQDPVAIDSVCFDFLYDEWSDYPRMAGTDDYLHEAAQANAPPSNTYYDPNQNGAGPRLASLGTHEHWNNAVERKYSRNLGTGNGIELLPAVLPTAVIQCLPTQGMFPLTVNCDGSGSSAPGGTITGYQWDFDGDGNTDATGPVASHEYQHHGTYLAKLTVTDNLGLSDSASVQVTVLGYPADFDDDTDVDQTDFGFLQACFTIFNEAPSPGCSDADLDHDNKIDDDDVTIFFGCRSGPGVTANLDCAG